MDKYNVNQLHSVKGFNVAIMKFEDTESLDGTLKEVISDPQGDYLKLEQHENEKVLLKDIEEMYLLIEGYLPIFYCPLDDYDTENAFYSEEYFEAFYDYVGEDVRMLGSFENGYEVEGILTEIDPIGLTLTVEDKKIDLWRINIVFQLGEDGKCIYLSPESMGETFEDPLDNLYSEEDFEMLVGKKIRIKTMVPEIADEIATVGGYTMGEGFAGEEVYHLELEEFPDHILEPSEIQFIFLIGDDGSETLVEPSGGSLYGQQVEEQEEQVDNNPDAKYFQEFQLGISPKLKPLQLDKNHYQLMELKFNDNEFHKITTAIKEWYEEGTPREFFKQVTDDIKVFDSRNLPLWYDQNQAIEEGYKDRPYSNYPVILIQDNRASLNKSDDLGNIIFFSLLDIDMLNEDFGLGLNNYSFAVGCMYEIHAESELDVLDHFKHAIINYKEHLKNYPKHVLALNSIGNNLYLLGKYEDALNYLNQALAIYPEWVIAIANKLDVLLNLNRFEEAKALIEKGQNFEPENGEWLWYHAKLKDKEGDKVGAIELGKKAVIMGYLSEEDLMSQL